MFENKTFEGCIIAFAREHFISAAKICVFIKRYQDKSKTNKRRLAQIPTLAKIASMNDVFDLPNVGLPALMVQLKNSRHSLFVHIVKYTQNGRHCRTLSITSSKEVIIRINSPKLGTDPIRFLADAEEENPAIPPLTRDDLLVSHPALKPTDKIEQVSLSTTDQTEEFPINSLGGVG